MVYLFREDFFITRYFLSKDNAKYIVYQFIESGVIEFYLQKENSGIIVFMAGLSENISEREIEDIIYNNIDNWIDCYKTTSEL